MITEKKKQYNKERYEWLKSHKICTRCGQEKAQKDRTMCRRCTLDAGQNVVERYHRMSPEKLEHYKEYQREYHSELRRKMLESGICTECRKRPAGKGHTICKICREKKCRREAEKRLENGTMPRIIMGKGEYCYFCGKSGCNGRKVCEECRERCIANLPKNKPADDHIWRKETAVMCDIFKKKKYKT